MIFSIAGADIFTSTAVSGCRAALDIGVMSPDATGAGDDCCEAMYQRKFADYGAYHDELADIGVKYMPITFPTYGRLHPQSLETLTGIAKRAAMRHGFRNVILRRTLRNVGAAIWTRAATMVLRCLPMLGKEAAVLLFEQSFVEEEAECIVS